MGLFLGDRGNSGKQVVEPAGSLPVDIPVAVSGNVLPHKVPLHIRFFVFALVLQTVQSLYRNRRQIGQQSRSDNDPPQHFVPETAAGQTEKIFDRESTFSVQYAGEGNAERKDDTFEAVG